MQVHLISITISTLYSEAKQRFDFVIIFPTLLQTHCNEQQYETHFEASLLLSTRIDDFKMNGLGCIKMGTVAEYISRFCNLVMQLSEQSSLMLVDKFIRDLKPKTRIELELKDPKNLDEAFRLADRYDAIVYRKMFSTEMDNYSKPTTIEYEAGGEPMQLDALHLNKNTKGKHQGTKLRENTRLQKLSDEERTHLRRLGACFRCRKTGHMARECTEPAKNNSRQ